MWRTNKHSLAWLILLVMALHALWPLLANAQPTAATPQMEICTSMGVQALPGAPDSAPAGLQHLAHCPLCPLGGDKTLAPPPVLLKLSAQAHSCFLFPAQAASPARPSQPHPTAQPRGPPHRT